MDPPPNTPTTTARHNDIDGKGTQWRTPRAPRGDLAPQPRVTLELHGPLRVQRPRGAEGRGVVDAREGVAARRAHVHVHGAGGAPAVDARVVALVEGLQGVGRQPRPLRRQGPAGADEGEPQGVGHREDPDVRADEGRDAEVASAGGLRLCASREIGLLSLEWSKSGPKSTERFCAVSWQLRYADCANSRKNQRKERRLRLSFPLRGSGMQLRASAHMSSKAQPCNLTCATVFALPFPPCTHPRTDVALCMAITIAAKTSLILAQLIRSTTVQW